MQSLWFYELHPHHMKKDMEQELVLVHQIVDKLDQLGEHQIALAKHLTRGLGDKEIEMQGEAFRSVRNQITHLYATLGIGSDRKYDPRTLLARAVMQKSWMDLSLDGDSLAAAIAKTYQSFNEGERKAFLTLGQGIKQSYAIDTRRSERKIIVEMKQKLKADGHSLNIGACYQALEQEANRLIQENRHQSYVPPNLPDLDALCGKDTLGGQVAISQEYRDMVESQRNKRSARSR